MKNKISAILLIIIFTLGINSCELEVSNPNSPTNENLKTYDGIRMTAIGMQARLSQAIGDLNTVSAAVSGETSPVIAYLAYQSLRKYPDISRKTVLDTYNSFMVSLWATQFQIVKSSNDIINNIQGISMEDALKKNITAFAELGKAMAFYTLITHWEKIPINSNVEHPSFVDRAAVINESLNLLNDAELNTATILPKFTSSIIGSKWDITNTIQAYKAKFLLMKGDYTNAAVAASKVTKESEFVYQVSSGTNPLWLHFTSSGFSQTLASWVEGAEKGDKRIAATVNLASKDTVNYGNDITYSYIKYNSPSLSYKIYTLNEMNLIKAECYARGGASGNATAEVNIVRNSAGLPNFTGPNVLREVFVQRYYELYLTAQHWEDLRRFKNDNINIVTEQRNTQLAHEWLVYPYTEVDTNPNASAQPLNINYGL